MTRAQKPTRSQIPEVLAKMPKSKKVIAHQQLRNKLATHIPEEKKKALTAQEQAFVTELVNSFGEITLKEAAIRAGYDPAKAKNWASRMVDPKENPHVIAAIQETRQEMAEVYGTTYERHMRDLMRIRDAAMQAGNFGAAVQAEFRRGQALGTVYVDRKEIRVGTIDSMSKEEVMKELERLKETYGTPPRELIDVTPEQVEQSVAEEEERYGDKTRNDDVPETEGQPARLPYNPD
jgi:hypothetical protein